MLHRRTLLVLIGWVMATQVCGCRRTAPRAAAVPDPLSTYLQFLPNSSMERRGWVVILPGSSGLTIFDDDRHYTNAAERLRLEGFDVLVVDYKPAWRAVQDRPDGIAGDRIAWVTGRAIDWMKTRHPECRDVAGAVIGWSLGGEGVISLVNDADECKRLGIAAAAAYYPSNQEERTLNNAVPILVLCGEDDNVTPIEISRRLIDRRGEGSEPAELISLPGAGHGFDVRSLTRPRTMRFPPIIGTRYTFAFNAEAAAKADKALSGYLRQRLPLAHRASEVTK